MDNNNNNRQPRRSSRRPHQRENWIHKNWWIPVLAFIGLVLLFSNNQCSSGICNLSFQDKTMGQVKTDLKTASEEALEMDKTVKGFIDANKQLVDNNSCSQEEYYYNKRASGSNSESSAPENVNIVYVETKTGETSSSEGETEREEILKSHEVSTPKASTTNNYNTKNYYYNSRARKSTNTKVIYRDREEEVTYTPTPAPTKAEVKKDCCSTTINGRLYKVVTYNVSEEQKAIRRSDEKGEYDQFVFQNGKWWTQVPN